MGCYAVGWFEDLLAGACEVSSREVRWRDVSGGRVDWADEIRMSAVSYTHLVELVEVLLQEGRGLALVVHDIAYVHRWGVC